MSECKIFEFACKILWSDYGSFCINCKRHAMTDMDSHLVIACEGFDLTVTLGAVSMKM